MRAPQVRWCELLPREGYKVGGVSVECEEKRDIVDITSFVLPIAVVDRRVVICYHQTDVCCLRGGVWWFR